MASIFVVLYPVNRKCIRNRCRLVDNALNGQKKKPINRLEIILYGEGKSHPDYAKWLQDKDNRDVIKTLRSEMTADDTAFRNWAIRFGMTPTERSKLPVVPEKPQSEMLQLIRKVKEG